MVSEMIGNLDVPHRLEMTSRERLSAFVAINMQVARELTSEAFAAHYSPVDPLVAESLKSTDANLQMFQDFG